MGPRPKPSCPDFDFGRGQAARERGVHECNWRDFVNYRLQSSSVNAAKPILLYLFLSAGNALAQSNEKEPAAIVELGGAAYHGLTGEGASFGSTVALEVTPMENWLEIEAELHPYSDGTRQNGVLTFFSKNLGLYPKEPSLWLASGQNGFMRDNTA